MTQSSAEDPAAQALWDRYCTANGTDASPVPPVERFGDSAEMAGELLGLVLDGVKTATAGLLRDQTASGEALPEAGGHWIVVDGRGVPRCVVRSAEIRVGVLGSVDAAFAWDEGEGERTRDWWLDAHRRYFVRQGERGGAPFDEENDLVVFERFDVVWTEP